MSDLTFEALVAAPRSRLNELMTTARGPSLASIAGWEFRGYNVLYPHEKLVMGIMGNIRFIKCFFVDDESGDPSAPTSLKGYNLKVKNGGLADPWSTVPDETTPKRIGHYRVYATRNRPGKNTYPQAIFFDYRQPQNNLFSGSTIDDYVVQPDPQNPDVLIGKAFTQVGPIRPATFFILERYQRHQR